jgi:uncharacterized protein (TIGR03663 family)
LKSRRGRRPRPRPDATAVGSGAQVRSAQAAAGGTATAAGGTAPAGEPQAAPEPDLFDRWFVPVALGILFVAAALRLPELALNPFHHDEGVNGFFTTNLVRDGIYRYDPANYHGPSLYYFALASEILFGLTTEAMRLVPAVFGIVLVGLVFPLRRYLGSIAVLVAGALLAVSPGAVYVSRYFIHETLVVAFTIGLVTSVVLYLDRRESKYLLAASVAAALLFTTKETAVITVGVLLIAVGAVNVYLRLRSGQGFGRTEATARRRTTTRTAPRAESVWINGVEYRPARPEAIRGPSTATLSVPGEHVAGVAVVFLVIYILLFSSLFTNFPEGLADSLAAYVFWFQHGDATQIQPISKYFEWMFPIEAPILVLGFAGGLIAAIRMPSRLWIVIGLWALGITLAFSIIQYKTPWIILNMLLPLALLAGLAVSALWRSPLRLAAPVVFGVAVLFSGFFAIDLNFNRYDDEAYPYVYVHSTRSMLELVDEVEATAARAGSGPETGVVIVSPDYWPLPWYFRDWPNAGFFGSIVDTEEAMIVASVNQEAELAPSIEPGYDRVGTYNLRPGVDLVLYVRSDIPKG